MIRFAPAAGLVLASPVVADALLGRRGIDDALLALLVGVVVATLALWLLQVASRTTPDDAPVDPSDESGQAPLGDSRAADTKPSTVG